MKQLLLMTTLAVAFFCAAANHTYIWPNVGSELTIIYDTEGTDPNKIKTLVSNVTQGDIVTVTGTTSIDFAAGATIEMTGQGDLVISNDLTGVDGLTVTNTSSNVRRMEFWGNTLLPSNSWATVFENVDIANIEIISSDEQTYRNKSRDAGMFDPNGKNLSNPQMMYPFWVRYVTNGNVRTMTCQLQAFIDNSIKCVFMELKQEGANIVGRVPRSCYTKANDTFSKSYLSNYIYGDDFDALRAHWMVDRDPSVNIPITDFKVLSPDGEQSGGYGVGQITAVRSDVPCLRLRGDITGIGGVLAIAANAVVDGRGADALQSGNMSSVNLNLAGELIVGDRCTSFGTQGGFQYCGTGGTFRVVATSPTHDDPYTSYRRDYVAKGGSEIDQPSNYAHSLLEMTNVECIIAGNSMPYKPKWGSARMFHYKVTTNSHDSIFATCQFQGSNSVDSLRCLLLKFQQSGFAIKAYAVTNWACNFAEGAYLGMDFENPGDLEPYIYKKYNNTSSSTVGKPFTATNMVCRFSKPGEFLFKGMTTNRMSNGRLVVEGLSSGARMMYEITSLPGFPVNGDVDVKDGGTLILSGGRSTPNTSVTGDNARLRIHKGGRLLKYANWALPQARNIQILGGVIEPGYLSAATADGSFCYLNNLTLADGGRVEGYVPANFGNYAMARWKVRGRTPSYCNMPLCMVGGANNAYTESFIDVADVTGDSESDLILTKPIVRYVNDTTHGNVALIKVGLGTVEVRHTMDVPSGVNIYGGAWKLGTSASTDASAQKFTLAGGTLAAAAGTSNVCGPLAITARGGKIKLGADATLTFADSSAATWAATEKVVVEGFAEKSIRFGASGTAAPRRRMFALADGTNLRVGDDGYLTAIPPGINISIR